MTIRKLLVLLVAPLVVIVLISYFALSGVGDQATPQADRIGRIVGNAYGIYAGLMIFLFVRGRIRRA